MEMRKINGSYMFTLSPLEADVYFDPVNISAHLAHHRKRYIHADFYNDMVAMFGEPMPLHSWWHGPEAGQQHNVYFANKQDAVLFKLKYFNIGV